MSETYYAIRNVKHDGKRYFRGDQLSIQREEDAKALLSSGAVSTEAPQDEVDEGTSRVQTPEEKEATRSEKGKTAPESPSKGEDDQEDENAENTSQEGSEGEDDQEEKSRGFFGLGKNKEDDDAGSETGEDL